MSDSPPDDKPKSDWVKAQVLYLQGLPHAEICKQCNVSIAALRKRAERKEWTPIRQTVIRHTETITRQAATHAADSVRPALQRHLKDLADSDALKGKSRSMAQTDAKANVVLKIAQTAKLVEGWGDVTEHVVRSTLLSSVSADSLGSSPAIDVSSEPASLPEPTDPA